jgi:CheY-like chemotaxis protein
MRVLIIDDNEPLRLGIVEVLEIKEYDPLMASNGQEGLEIAIEYQPDIIFCDMKMPMMNGYETLVEIRNNPTTANIPFVLLTGETLADSWDTFVDAGANDWLGKPFSYDDFFAIIDSYES